MFSQNSSSRLCWNYNMYYRLQNLLKRNELGRQLVVSTISKIVIFIGGGRGVIIYYTLYTVKPVTGRLLACAKIIENLPVTVYR